MQCKKRCLGSQLCELYCSQCLVKSNATMQMRKSYCKPLF